MARAYMTKKQMPRDYWFHAIQHSCRMSNQILAKVEGKLTTPFEIFHHVAPDICTWFPIFSIAYFYKESDSDKYCTTLQAMIGITVGLSTKTNTLSVYNPITKHYYEPDTYKFNTSRLPCTDPPSQIHYDEGLQADL